MQARYGVGWRIEISHTGVRYPGMVYKKNMSHMLLYTYLSVGSMLVEAVYYKAKVNIDWWLVSKTNIAFYLA